MTAPAAASSGWRSGHASLRSAVGPIELAYDERGEGTPLVMVMGIGAQRIFWDDELCARLVARGFRVIRFDHRDIGGSTRLNHLPVPRPRRVILRRMAGLAIDAPYTLSDMASDVIGLCDHLGVARAHVVGASMGGMVAQHLAIEHPARIASLTSIMSTPGSRRWMLATRPRALAMLLAPRPRTADESAELAVRTFRAIGGTRFDPDVDRLRALGRQAFENGPSPRGFLRHLAAVCASGDRTAALARVRTPTAVFHGSADPLIPVGAGRATARAIPGASLRIIDGMGHHLPTAIWDDLIASVVQVAARA